MDRTNGSIREYLIRKHKQLMKPKPLPKMKDVFNLPGKYKVPKDSKYSF